MLNRTIRVAVATLATSTLAAVGAVGGSVAAPALARAAGTPPVTFSSNPTTAAIVAHYTVTPAMRSGASAGSTSNGDSQDQLPDLSPKNFNRPAARPFAAAPNTTVSPMADSRSGTPPTTRSFIGQQGSSKTCSYFAHGCNPPDMALATSPNFVLQGVNTQFEVLNPSGKVLPGWPVSGQRFFNVPKVSNPDGSSCDPGSGDQPFMSDPRALYDPASHRFWAAMLQVEGGLGIAPNCPFKSVYFIAVSQTSDPSGNWNVYEFEMAHGTPFAADYTQIGLNHDAVFFSANMFGITNGFYGEVFEANKAQMERGKADFTADGFFNIQGDGPGVAIAGVGPLFADTLQPAMDLSGTSGNGDGGDGRRAGGGSHDGLFVDTVDGPDLMNGNLCTGPTDTCQGMILWRLTNPVAHDHGGPAPTFSGTYLPDTKPFYSPPKSDQPSCNACVDGNDLRIPATPMLKNGTIYTGWGTGVNNGTQEVPAVEWAQVKVGGGGEGDRAPSVTTGYFTLSGDHAATYPAFMPDDNGGVVMLYEHMSNSTFPEAKYVVSSGEEPGFNGTGRVLKAGEASYRPTLCGTAIPVCRWGDYEAMSTDGNGNIWMAGEYTNTHTDPAVAPWFGRNWGTWMGAVSSDSLGG